MKEYNLYLKSHCEAPDYEDSVVAESKLEAARRLQARAARLTDEPPDMLEIVRNMDEGEVV